MPPRYPDFYCIGAQKAATTWLYRCLQGHPRVFTSAFKEVHYFDSLHVSFHRRIHTNRIRAAMEYFAHPPHAKWGPLRHLLQSPKQRRMEQRMHWWLAQRGATIDDAWFGGVFADARADQCIADVTPAYAALPKAGIAHMRRLNPRARLLLILRDPVQRTFSHAKMVAVKRGLPLTDDNLLQMSVAKAVASRDAYPRQIDRFSKAFGEEQFMVAFHEAEIVLDPQDFLRRLCLHLRLAYQPQYFRRATKIVNRGAQVRMSPRVHAVLLERHRDLIAEMQRRYPHQTKSWGQVGV